MIIEKKSQKEAEGQIEKKSRLGNFAHRGDYRLCHVSYNEVGMLLLVSYENHHRRLVA